MRSFTTGRRFWFCWAFGLFLFLSAVGTTAGTGGNRPDDMSDDPEVERRLMELPPGFEIQLVAAEPDVINPIQMNFDTQGRLWVVCAPRYPQLLPGQAPADYVLVLDKFDGRGKARSARVFATGLMVPTGLAPGDGGVYVGQADTLYHFRDNKETGKVEKRVLLTGFGTQDTHHTLNTFRWGPDAALYFNQGIYIKSTVETPFGPRQLFGGCIWQLRTDRLRLEVFDRSILDNNTWGHVFDAWGQSFVSSAWPADLNWVLPDSPLQSGAARELITPLKLTRIGGGRHCGLEIISGRHFPADWQGDLLTGDFLTHRVQRYRFNDDGRQFTATPLPPLVVSRHRKFRPVDIKIGPDGAIYVADLYQQIIQHNQIDFRDPRRDHKHGRIWRIIRKDRPLVPRPELAGVSVERVLDHLKDPEQWTRIYAKRALAERDHMEVAAALAIWTARLDASATNHQRHLLEALWTHQAIDQPNVPLLNRLLRSDDFRVRVAGTRVLGAWSDRLEGPERLIRIQADDVHPRVRLEAVLAASRVPSTAAVEAALRALDQPTSPLLEFTLRKTVSVLKPHWYPQFQKGTFTFGGRAKALTFALEAIRAADALPALSTLLKTGKVPRENEAGVLILLAQIGTSADRAFVFERVCSGNRLDSAARTRILEALSASVGAPKAPEKAAERLLALLKEARVPLKVAAIRLAGAWKLESLRAELSSLADSEAAAPRQAAIAALVSLSGPNSIRRLEELAGPTHPYVIRANAIVGLADLDTSMAARLAVDLLSEPITAGHDPAGVFSAFLHRAGGATALAAELKAKAPSSDAAKIGIRVINSYGIKADALLGVLQARTGEAGKARLLDGKELRRLVALVQKQGDAARGEQVFRRPSLGCMQCHAISGAGGRVGPDLATIGASAPLDYLIESILLPAKVVKDGYTTANIVTKTGRVISGVLLRESPRELVLRDPTHDEITVTMAEIEERQTGGSLMPSGLDHTLTDAELADLVRFLSELGRPGPYALSHRPVARRWQYLAGPPPALALDGHMAGKILQEDRQLDWRPVYSLASGQLPLADIPGARDGIIFVRCQLAVSAAGKIDVILNDREGLKLWVDGAATPIQEGLPLNLSRGRHTLLFSINSSLRKNQSLSCEAVIPPKSTAQVSFGAGN